MRPTVWSLQEAGTWGQRPAADSAASHTQAELPQDTVRPPLGQERPEQEAERAAGHGRGHGQGATLSLPLGPPATAEAAAGRRPCLCSLLCNLEAQSST